MKKIVTPIILGLLIFFSPKVDSQIIYTNDFENWTGNMPDGFGGSATNLPSGSISAYTDDPYEGTYSCKLQNATSSHQRFTTTSIAVQSGALYIVTLWAKGGGDIRAGLFIPENTSYSYADYAIVNNADWQKLSFSIVAGASSQSAQLILSLRNTAAGQNHLQIDSLTVIGTEVTITPIYDIQYTTEASGDSPYKSQIVTTAGIVTAVYSDGFWIQDGSGPWSGIYIYNNTINPTIGDSLTLTGTVDEYFNLTQLKWISANILNSQGNTLPAPTVITTQEGNTEPYESVLVKVENATCSNSNVGFGMWQINDGSGVLLVGPTIYSYPSPVLAQLYNITGILYYSYSEWKVLPRSINDVSLVQTAEVIENAMELSLYPNPASTKLHIRNIDKTALVAIYNVLGEKVFEAKPQASNMHIELDGWADGIYFVKVTGVDGAISTQRFVRR